MKTIVYLAMLIASALLQFVTGNSEQPSVEPQHEWTECKLPVSKPNCEIDKVKTITYCS